MDAADKAALPAATEELHDLMTKPTLDGIPLLVLGNKSDLPIKLSVDELIAAMNLKSITHREVSCYGISAKEETNLDAVLHWLIARASRWGLDPSCKRGDSTWHDMPDPQLKVPVTVFFFSLSVLACFCERVFLCDYIP